MEHAVEVEASTIFEAAVKALQLFRLHEWTAEESDWTGVLRVVAKQPEVEHKVLLKNLKAFLNRKGGSPREIIHREKLSDILEGRPGTR